MERVTGTEQEGVKGNIWLIIPRNKGLLSAFKIKRHLVKRQTKKQDKVRRKANQRVKWMTRCERRKDEK